jgi:hypothetical protein
MSISTLTEQVCGYPAALDIIRGDHIGAYSTAWPAECLNGW